MHQLSCTHLNKYVYNHVKQQYVHLLLHVLLSLSLNHYNVLQKKLLLHFFQQEYLRHQELYLGLDRHQMLNKLLQQHFPLLPFLLLFLPLLFSCYLIQLKLLLLAHYLYFLLFCHSQFFYYFYILYLYIFFLFLSCDFFNLLRLC